MSCMQMYYSVVHAKCNMFVFSSVMVRHLRYGLSSLRCVRMGVLRQQVHLCLAVCTWCLLASPRLPKVALQILWLLLHRKLCM